MEDAAIESKILEISRSYAAINQKVEEFVVGNRPLIDSILIALLSEGHILIEGVPGTAKTTIAKSIAIMTGCEFNRIQGAIDLQPADMLGVASMTSNKRSLSCARARSLRTSSLLMRSTA